MCTGMSGGYNIGWYANTNASMQPTSLSASYINDRGAGTASAEVVPNSLLHHYKHQLYTGLLLYRERPPVSAAPSVYRNPDRGPRWTRWATA